MRVSIREQLALLILLSSLIGLAVISVATWISNHSFVLSICKSRLALTASLKAAQLGSNLDLMQTTGNLISTRVIIQAALERYNEFGNNTNDNWSAAAADMAAIIGSGGSLGQALLLQSVVFPTNGSGPDGNAPLLKTTSRLTSDLKLPYTCPNGVRATLGMSDSDCGGASYGFPPALYPNLTYIAKPYNSSFKIQQAEFDGDVIGPEANEAMLIGPMTINDTFSLVSLTVPIINNTSMLSVLGWLTVVMDGRLIKQVLDSTEGLENTGETLLIGPVNKTNHFPNGILYNSNRGHVNDDFLVQYVSPLNVSYEERHSGHVYGTANKPFRASEYPAVLQAITDSTGQEDNSGAVVKGHNEDGKQVAVGYAFPKSDLVDWVVLVEQARSEVWKPIKHLQDILLACVFATAGLMAVFAWPLAHLSVLPIRRLQEATSKSVEPPGQSFSRSSLGSFDSSPEHTDGAVDAEAANRSALARKEGVTHVASSWRTKRRADREARREQRRKQAFRIPGKVKERKHCVKDELSDLTATFNEMSDELMMQYSRLEERVQERTAELEESKKAAEVANESKTLFIANISHELKTPLNGILGMCAVCMQEDDPTRLKRSLGIIYKSGDLLLNLLTDLLTFSKNQVGQQLTLDEKDFRLRDVSSQILAVFDKQAADGQIDLKVAWEGVAYPQTDDAPPERSELGPHGTGRLKDMILWGDLQRILQVVINLVSNALKFTPSGGSVVLTIRCLPELADISRKTSHASKQSRQSRPTNSRHHNSDSSLPNSINVRDKPNQLNSIYAHERTASPPPGLYIYYEFEVTDTGPGIPDHLQHKIFEPFVQGDLGLSKKFGGTGLGLSICSQLATLMRGSIGVRSTVGSGSTFTMKIPLRHLKSRADSEASSRVDLQLDSGVRRSASLEDADRALARHSRADESGDEKAPSSGSTSPPKLTTESQPRLVGLSQPFFASSQPMESPSSQPAAMEKMAAEATRTGNRIRVLVAEDNKVNQEVVLRMLKLEDVYDVTVAKDGQEALDFVKESMTPTSPGKAGEERKPKPYNLIFMDVQMPNVDGLQSTRLIREIGYQAPIVALTAFAEESNIKDCMESGMNYFLSKPIRRPQLKKVLKEYCAPIPEESEEPSPSEDQGHRTATIVVVNEPGGDPLSEIQKNRPLVEEASVLQEPRLTAGETRRSDSPPSPFTTS